MKRYALFLLSVVAISLLAPAAFAQETGAAAGSGANWVAITSGFAMAIASAAGGYAQAKATAAACEGLARNPGAAATQTTNLLLGFALCEATGLFGLVIALLILFAF